MRGLAETISLRSAHRARSMLLASTLLFACGGGGDHTQGAAGMGPTPGMGMPCTVNCTSGLVCESSGTFAGQCTAGCGSGAACQLLAASSACFDSKCGLMCTTNLECPMGTTCQAAAGGFACRIAPMMP